MAGRNTRPLRLRLVVIFFMLAGTMGALWLAYSMGLSRWTIAINSIARTESGRFERPSIRTGDRVSPSSQPESESLDYRSPTSGAELQPEKEKGGTDALSLVIAKVLRPSRTTLTPNIETPTLSSTDRNESSTIPPRVKTTQAVGAKEEVCDRSCRWWREQENRQRRVKETCAAIKGRAIRPAVHSRLTPATLRTMSSLLVLPSHKLIYCYVPKVSCTNWKRIFLVAKGVYPSVQAIEQRQAHIATDFHIRTLSSYSLSTADRLLKTYKKFMFVRHPFERILSAYVDKFQLDYPSSKHFRETSGLQMARYGGLTRTPRLKDGTVNITFQQFASYVSDSKNQDLEPHWKEMYRQCQPCMVHYDYLGKYSTLKEDADFILEAAKLSQTFPESTNPTGSSSRSKMLRYFSQLTAGEIESLHRRYLVDFKLFDYAVPSYLLNSTNS